MLGCQVVTGGEQRPHGAGWGSGDQALADSEDSGPMRTDPPPARSSVPGGLPGPLGLLGASSASRGERPLQNARYSSICQENYLLRTLPLSGRQGSEGGEAES